MGSFVQNRCFTASPSPQTPYKPKKSRKSSVPCQRIFKSPIFSHPCASRASANQPLGNHPPATRNQTPLGGAWLRLFKINSAPQPTHPKSLTNPKNRKNRRFRVSKFSKAPFSAMPARASRGADQPLRQRPTRHPQSNPRGGGSGFVCSKSTPPCNSLIPNLLRTEKIARITPSVSANFQKPGFHRTLSAPQHHPQVSFSSNGIKISSRRTLHA